MSPPMGRPFGYAVVTKTRFFCAITTGELALTEVYMSARQKVRS